MSGEGNDQRASGGVVDFTDWYAAEMPRMTVAIRAAVLDHELADEAVSEAFARAWLHWGKVQRMDSLRGWVYTVALNQARTIARRTKRDLDAIVDVPTATPYDDHPSDADELWQAVRRLAPQARRADRAALHRRSARGGSRFDHGHRPRHRRGDTAQSTQGARRITKYSRCGDIAMMDLEDRLRALGDTSPSASDKQFASVMRRGRRLRKRRIVTRVVAPIAAAAIAATAVVIPVIGPKPLSRTEASEFLVSVGARAGAQSVGETAAVNVWYVQVQHGMRGGVLEYWYARAGGGHLVKTSGTGRVSTETAQLHLVAGSKEVTWDQLMALPTDADQLYEWLYEAVGDAGPDKLTEMWAATWDLLRQSPAPSALRRALYLVAARLPGVTIEPGLIDGIGRVAVGISHSWPGGSTRYLVDEATGAVMEHQELIGTEVTYRDTYIAQGPAEGVGTRPNPANS